MLEDAFEQGREGVRNDARLFSDESWTALLGSIRADTHLWVGDRDPDVAGLDARWWADRIPNAHATRVRDSGPLVLAAAWSKVLGHVAPNHGSVAEELRDSGEVYVAAVDSVDPEHG
jgi:pimeloyl-ACP methyl ester carboxylesterase